MRQVDKEKKNTEKIKKNDRSACVRNGAVNITDELDSGDSRNYTAVYYMGVSGLNP